MRECYSLKTLLENYRIVIPLIQRGYAHGRDNKEAESIRSILLSSVKDTLLGKRNNISLDFSYGYVKKDKETKVFYPYDGQQRLTTLLLVHAYLYRKAGRLNEIKLFSGFSYEGRPLSGKYIKSLAMVCQESFLSNTFYWKQDPSAESMARTYFQIGRDFADIECSNDILDKLDNVTIIIRDLGFREPKQMDDAFIKMNSRGRRLTEAETFKAGLLRIAKDNIIWRNDINNFKASFLNYYEHLFSLGKTIDDVDGEIMSTVRKYLAFCEHVLNQEISIVLSGFVPFSSYGKVIEKDVSLLKPLKAFYDYLIRNELDDLLPKRKKGKKLEKFDMDEIASIIMAFSCDDNDERRRRINVCFNIIDNTSVSKDRREVLRHIASLDTNVYDYLGSNMVELENIENADLRIQLEEEMEKARLINSYKDAEEKILEAENLLFFSGAIRGLLGWEYGNDEGYSLLEKRMERVKNLFRTEKDRVELVKKALGFGMKNNILFFAYIFSFDFKNRSSFWPSLFIDPEEKKWRVFAYDLMDGRTIEDYNWMECGELGFYIGPLLNNMNLVEVLMKPNEAWACCIKYGFPVIALYYHDYSYHYMLDGLLVEKGRLFPSQILQRVQEKLKKEGEALMKNKEEEYDFSIYPAFQGNGSWHEFTYRGDDGFAVSVVSDEGDVEDRATAVIVHCCKEDRSSFCHDSSDEERAFRLIVPNAEPMEIQNLIDMRADSCIEWLKKTALAKSL